jgi:hypothetical protein
MSIENKSIKKKLYVYVDESGQDTKGLIFVVSVLVLEDEKPSVSGFLEEAEKESGKKNAKWNGCNYEFRKKYIEYLLKSEALKKKIFFDTFSDVIKYIELTSFASAKAILKKSGDNYKATIFVDGLKKKEIEVFKRGLRDLHIKVRKVRGVKKDENNSFIRLVDAICGLVRDAGEGEAWAKTILEKLQDRSIVSKL